MPFFLKILLKQTLRIVLPLLRQYVSQTETKVDDMALDAVEEVLKSSGFAQFASENVMAIHDEE